MTFIQESSRLLNSLRVGIRSLMASIPGGRSVRTSLDLERWLGVNRKLAWQLFRFNQAGVRLADARHLPTEAPFRKFIATAVQHGADKAIAETVVERYRAVEHFIDHECGSRVSFESMISDDDREALADVTARQKKAMYEAACHLWGIRAAARFCLHIIFPSETDGDYLDVVHFDGLMGLHCQRNMQTWPVTSVAIVGPEGGSTGSKELEFLDDAARRELGVPVIRRFSSHPLPTLEMHDIPSEARSLVMARFHDMGRGASMDLTFGYLARRASVKYRELNKVSVDSGFGMSVRAPCEVFVSDFLVHESVRFLHPSVHLLALNSDLSTHALHLSRATRLPIDEVVEELGMGPSLLTSDDRMPKHADLIELGLQRTNLPANAFRAYRCQIDHPVLSTLVSISFPMPSMND